MNLLARLRSLILWRALDLAYRRHFAHYLVLHDVLAGCEALYDRLNPRRHVYRAEACRRLSLRHRSRALGPRLLSVWTRYRQTPYLLINKNYTAQFD